MKKNKILNKIPDIGKLDQTAIYILFIITLFLHPFNGGLDYASLSCPAFFCVGLFIYCRQTPNLQGLIRNAKVASPYFIFLFYMFLNQMLRSNTSNAVYSLFFANTLTIMGSIFAFSNIKIELKYFDIFRNFLVLMSLSGIVTNLLHILLPSIDTLIATVPVRGYLSVSLYFPFSIVYSEEGFVGLSVYRMSANFQEAGLAQAFYSWGMFTLNRNDPKYRIKYILLVLGMIQTLSPVGYVFAMINITYGAITIRNRIKNAPLAYRFFFVLIASIISILIYIYIFDPSLELRLSGDSSQDRLDAFSYQWMKFLDSPLFGAPNTTSYWSEGISLISSIGYIGLFGSLNIIVAWFYAIYTAKFPMKKFLALVDLIFTFAFAQPTAITSFSIILFMHDPTAANEDDAAKVETAPLPMTPELSILQGR